MERPIVCVGSVSGRACNIELRLSRIRRLAKRGQMSRCPIITRMKSMVALPCDDSSEEGEGDEEEEEERPTPQELAQAMARSIGRKMEQCDSSGGDVTGSAAWDATGYLDSSSSSSSGNMATLVRSLLLKDLQAQGPVELLSSQEDGPPAQAPGCALKRGVCLRVPLSSVRLDRRCALQLQPGARCVCACEGALCAHDLRAMHG